MEDRLRELIDVVLETLDEPVDGASLAQRVHFSRDPDGVGECTP